MSVLYRDSQIEIDEQGVTIFRYSLPFRFSKRRVAWNQLHAVTLRPLGFWNGKYRISGMGPSLEWFNWDFRRPSKSEYLTLDTGGWIKPAVTPERARDAFFLIQDKLASSPADRST